MCVAVFFVLGLHRILVLVCLSVSLMQMHTLTDADSERTFGARLLAHGKYDFSPRDPWQAQPDAEKAEKETGRVSRWRGGCWEELNREGEDPVVSPLPLLLASDLPAGPKGTPLPSGQLQLVIHHGDLGGERSKPRTSRGICSQRDPEEWGGDGGAVVFIFLPAQRLSRAMETPGGGV